MLLKILKLSDVKVLGQSGQRISARTEQQMAASGSETRGTGGSLSVGRGQKSTCKDKKFFSCRSREDLHHEESIPICCPPPSLAFAITTTLPGHHVSASSHAVLILSNDSYLSEYTLALRYWWALDSCKRVESEERQRQWCLREGLDSQKGTRRWPLLLPLNTSLQTVAS